MLHRWLPGGWTLILMAVLLPCGPACIPGATLRAPPPSDPPTETREMTFETATAQLISEIEVTAADGLRVELRESDPGELGWSSTEGTPARVIILWAPSGVHLSLGLLPRRGRYAHAGEMRARGPEEQGGTPRLIAVGPGLVVVSAPSPVVALTREIEQRDGPRLAAALASSVTAWSEGETLEGPARPAGLEAATRVIRHPHWLEIELPSDGTLDPASILSDEVDALSFREAPRVSGGLLPVPSLLLPTP